MSSWQISDDLDCRPTKERLRQSEERFRALVSASADVVYSMSPDWSEMRHLEGREFVPDTLEPNRSWLQRYVHPEDQARVLAAISHAIGTRGIFESEHRVVRRDGTVGWTSSRAVPIFDGQGEIIEWFGVARDITERRQAEQLHTEQNRALEMIATGRPLDECLRALTDATARLSPGVRACVLVANAQRDAIADIFTVHFPPSFGAGVRGAPIGALDAGTCGTAIHTGQPVSCTDLEGSGPWSPMWRQLCLAHGVRACHSTPIFGAGRCPVASFFLCLPEPRPPRVWEQCLGEFGAHAAGIAIERGARLQPCAEANSA